MIETKLPGMVINRIDTKSTYDTLVENGEIGENDLCLVEDEDSIPPGATGTDISLGVTGASVGDIVKVKAVDDSGKPTEWGAANSAVEIANGVDVSAVSSFEYSADLAGNAITSNHLKLVLCAPNLQDTQKWLHITINDLRLRVHCYFNSFWVCDIKILKDFICFTLGKSGFSTTAEGTYTSAGINKIEETYVIATATDYTNLNKMISCQYNYGINNPAWGESAQLWIWGE